MVSYRALTGLLVSCWLTVSPSNGLAQGRFPLMPSAALRSIVCSELIPEFSLSASLVPRIGDLWIPILERRLPANPYSSIPPAFLLEHHPMLQPELVWRDLVPTEVALKLQYLQLSRSLNELWCLHEAHIFCLAYLEVMTPFLHEGALTPEMRRRVDRWHSMLRQQVVTFALQAGSFRGHEFVFESDPNANSKENARDRQERFRDAYTAFNRWAFDKPFWGGLRDLIHGSELERLLLDEPIRRLLDSIRVWCENPPKAGYHTWEPMRNLLDSIQVWCEKDPDCNRTSTSVPVDPLTEELLWEF